MIKQKRKEKVGKWEVPINKVKAVSEAEAFKVASIDSIIDRHLPGGQVGQDETQGLEAHGHEGLLRAGDVHAQAAEVRAIHPTYGIAIQEGARHTPRAAGARCRSITHTFLQTTFQLPLIGVKKNPTSATYTNLGIITKVSLFYSQLD